jgi:uncharacterized protein YkwD
MKRIFSVLLSLMSVVVFSCASVQEAFSSSDTSSGGGTTPTVSKRNNPNKRQTPDTANWNIAKLDTAANADYLTGVEKDVILEMNMARTNPKLYAELYIKPVLNYNWGGPFGANSYLAPGATVYTRTQEGRRAVNNCINAMNRWTSMKPLQPEKGLWKAANEHSLDQSKTGQTGHTGSDGSTPSTRIKKYGTFGSSYTMGENCSYGPNSGRDIVVGYLIDDGVPSRGHRDNILNTAFSQVGNSVQTHPQYRSCGTVDFAAGYTSN